MHVIDPPGLFIHVVFGMKKRELTPASNLRKNYNFPSASDNDLAAKPRRGGNHGETLSLKGKEEKDIIFGHIKDVRTLA